MSLKPYEKSQLTLGLLGPDGTFSSEAAHNYLRKRNLEFNIIYITTISHCFQSLYERSVDSIIVPLSNSSTGPVIESFRNFKGGEIYYNETLPIHLYLAGNPNARHIHTKIQIAQQCKRKLSGLDAKIILENSSATAAIKARETNQAAIVSKRAAEIYGLDILERDVQDNKDNKTLFGVIKCQQ